MLSEIYDDAITLCRLQVSAADLFITIAHERAALVAACITGGKGPPLTLQFLEFNQCRSILLDQNRDTGFDLVQIIRTHGSKFHEDAVLGAGSWMIR